MARVDNVLNTFGGFLITLSGYGTFAMAALLFACGVYMTYSGLRKRNNAEREPGEAPLAVAAACFGLALLLVLSGRLDLKIARNNSYRDVRQTRALMALL